MTDPTAEGPAWVAPGSMPPPTPPTTAMPAPTAGYPSVAPPASSYPTAYPSAYQPAPIPPPTAALPTRPDFRPGIVPLRPLNLGDIFPGVIASIRGNPKATMGLTLLICLAFLVPFTALGAWVASTNTPCSPAPSGPAHPKRSRASSPSGWVAWSAPRSPPSGYISRRSSSSD